MKKVYICSYIFVGLFLLPSIGRSQYTWSRFTNHNEFIFGVGPSQLLGDVGGSANVGTHFLGDFNFGAVRYSFEGGYRYHISPIFAVKGVLTTGVLSGSDALSKEVYRHNRNITVRTFLMEASGQFEWYFYRSSQAGHHYHIRHARGLSNFNIDAYAFLGIGGFYFNPKGPYNGAWYSLRPMSTEGEGLPGGPPEYSQFGLSIPGGIGVKYNISPQWAVGLEISDRIWTSSDYLDDTHGVYFNNAVIAADKGTMAAYFADPSLHSIQQEFAPDGTGQPRGDAMHNDTYMFVFATLTYQPPFHRRTRSKF